MSQSQNATVESNVRPEYDDEIQKIADYVLNYSIDEESPNSTEAWRTARYCLMDTLGCGILALRFPECTTHPCLPLVECSYSQRTEVRVWQGK